MHAVLLLCPALDGQHMPLSMAYHPPLCTQEDKALLSYKKNPSIVHQLVAGLAGKKKKKVFSYALQVLVLLCVIKDKDFRAPGPFPYVLTASWIYELPLVATLTIRDCFFPTEQWL